MSVFKIALIGEAYGVEEEYAKRPFIGPAGQELNRMLSEAGIERGQCYVSNVFNFRPDRNDILTLCCGAKDPERLPEWPAIAPARYVRREFRPEIDRLIRELEEVRPNVAVLLGNTACWALLRQTAISKIRGAVTSSPVLPGLKVLPTYHPAGVLRQYDLRAVTVLDLKKAGREAEFPEIRRLNRTIWLDPSLQDIRDFIDAHIRTSPRTSVDIETAYGQITCIGFAPRADLAIVIPFFNVAYPKGSYWMSLEEEVEAWRLVAEVLDTPGEKVLQNGLYDIQYLWMKYGIPVRNFSQDTMLLHHSLQPESPKGLDFLGSVYANEPAWKQDRPRGKNTIKRED